MRAQTMGFDFEEFKKTARRNYHRRSAELSKYAHKVNLQREAKIQRRAEKKAKKIIAKLPARLTKAANRGESECLIMLGDSISPAAQIVSKYLKQYGIKTCHGVYLGLFPCMIADIVVMDPGCPI